MSQYTQSETPKNQTKQKNDLLSQYIQSKTNKKRPKQTQTNLNKHKNDLLSQYTQSQTQKNQNKHKNELLLSQSKKQEVITAFLANVKATRVDYDVEFVAPALSQWCLSNILTIYNVIV